MSASSFVSNWNRMAKSEAIKQLLKEKESLIESGITGVVCSDDKVEFRYIYSEKFIENDLTGLSFGYSFDEALARFNDEYAKAINNSYTYKSYPKDEEFIDCAYTLIYNALKSPSTASLVSSEVFEKDKYGLLRCDPGYQL